MESQHILVLIGISGSGKSTEARKLCAQHPYVRVNRDELRMMMFGYTPEDIGAYYQRNDMYQCEIKVSHVIDAIINRTLKYTKSSILVDNTSLKEKYITQFERWGVPVKLKLIDTPFKVAVERDLKRPCPVGEKVIGKQAQQLEVLKKGYLVGRLGNQE